MDSETTHPSRTAEALPPWTSVLAVAAHPEDRAPGLAAVLETFARAGAAVRFLCLSHGRVPPERGDPDAVEVARAPGTAVVLDASPVALTVLDHPAGALDEVCRTRLATDIVVAAGAARAEGLLVPDQSGIPGHPDHVATTAAALLAAESADLPVLGWTQPEVAPLDDELLTHVVDRGDGDGGVGALHWLRETSRPAFQARLAIGTPTSTPTAAVASTASGHRQRPSWNTSGGRLLEMGVQGVSRKTTNSAAARSHNVSVAPGSVRKGAYGSPPLLAV